MGGTQRWRDGGREGSQGEEEGHGGTKGSQREKGGKPEGRSGGRRK